MQCFLAPATVLSGDASERRYLLLASSAPNSASRTLSPWLTSPRKTWASRPPLTALSQHETWWQRYAPRPASLPVLSTVHSPWGVSTMRTRSPLGIFVAQMTQLRSGTCRSRITEYSLALRARIVPSAWGLGRSAAAATRTTAIGTTRWPTGWAAGWTVIGTTSSAGTAGGL